MGDFLASAYPWMKTFHLLSLISWMCGLLYLPRLFVYHAEKGTKGSELSETYKVMERRLLRGIMTPAMIATWVFGLALMMTPGIIDWSAGWFYIKLVCVIAMSGLHMWFAARRTDFAKDENKLSGRTYRFMNEAPAVLMIVIVIMVIVRPV